MFGPMARRGAPLLDEVPPGAVARAAAQVRHEGAVPLKKLERLAGKLSVAAARLFWDELGRAGIERTGRHARLPIGEQLAALLSSGPVETRALRRRLKGLSSPTEAAHAVRTAVAEKRAQLAFAAGKEVLVPPGEPLVDGAERSALLEMAARLVKLGRGAKQRPLLRREVAPWLAIYASWALEWLRGEIAARVTAERPFVFIPELARALAPSLAPERLREELLRGATAGCWELRPESGVGLLGADDAALCPRGWKGEILSYVRPVEPR
jgi:hypothetical protein